MKIRGHESFFIRKGWLFKGLKNVEEKDDVFTDKNNNPMDVLGLGSNMVKSLRYWLQAVGLTEENKSGLRRQRVTRFGQIIWDNDKYMEELGSLWLLHHKLSSNIENATSWYFFFNEFQMSEFKKEDFVLALSNHVKMKYGVDLAEASFENDFECIVNTYIPRNKSNPGKVTPENNIDCPLGELGLLEIANKKERIYRKTQPIEDTVHPLILLSVILSNSNQEKEIKISKLLSEKCNVGKSFNLDMVVLMKLLYQIEKLGYIKVVRTAGLDVVKIITSMSAEVCMEAYYAKLRE